MNKNPFYQACIDACVRILNSLEFRPSDPSYRETLGFARDVARMMNGMQKELSFFPMHPDVLAEALAYECKKPHPNAEVIDDLTIALQSH